MVTPALVRAEATSDLASGHMQEAATSKARSRLKSGTPSCSRSPNQDVAWEPMRRELPRREEREEKPGQRQRARSTISPPPALSAGVVKDSEIGPLSAFRPRASSAPPHPRHWLLACLRG